MIPDILFGLAGLAWLLAIAFAFSSHKRKIDWRLVGTGVALQIVFALFVLKVPGGEDVFNALSKFFVTIINFTFEGAEFVFGILSSQTMMEKMMPPDMQNMGFGFIFAFQVLPTIIFFSSLMSVLYHLGIMQKVVQGMAWVMAKTMRVSGSESLSVAANVFIGQTEAPLVVRPYVASMTQSELLTLMVGGMATIAGGVLAAYVNILGGTDPQMQVYYAKHLLSASIMAAPATMVIAKLLKPEVEHSETKGVVELKVEKNTANVIDAAATGAGDGLKLALNVAAMLLAFIALIAMANYILEAFGNITGLNTVIGQPLNLNLILGYLLAPISWIIGVPWQDAIHVGTLIGQKVVINEFIAYLELGNMIQDGMLSEKARIISTYALCGFANFSSIAIQIGGIGGIAPNRRKDLARFGLRAVLGGSLATFMTATIAGVLTSL
ncbi:MAG: NupC/NupG family nucleoside CNT transporter [Calditrichaeota bacterium]|nr:NupC/NupG family nucleoside CNT transporter [Calditrichota bacterium]RQW08125.1 MAG: NupC/NupG family nucleoside CNT transporter [Calditrichota bacterium]